MQELFAIPCVGAIIEKIVDGEKYILLQTRFKQGGGDTNGKLELPAGKIREYENIISALYREVYEETGLKITQVHNGDLKISTSSGQGETISFEPFCVTQNLSGVYSIILMTFICEADGDLLEATDESKNIQWVKEDIVRHIILSEPDKMFFMHVNALKKYLFN